MICLFQCIFLFSLCKLLNGRRFVLYHHIARRQDRRPRLQSSLSFMQAGNSVVVSTPASFSGHQQSSTSGLPLRFTPWIGSHSARRLAGSLGCLQQWPYKWQYYYYSPRSVLIVASVTCGSTSLTCWTIMQSWSFSASVLAAESPCWVLLGEPVVDEAPWDGGDGVVCWGTGCGLVAVGKNCLS